MSWGRLPTPQELEAAIKRRLLDVGVAEKNIDIDDRGVLNNPVFLRSYRLDQCAASEDASLVRGRDLPEKLHHVCPRPFRPTMMKGARPWARFGHYPIVKGKTRLNILSALTPNSMEGEPISSTGDMSGRIKG